MTHTVYNLCMQLTVKIKLLTSDDQKVSLLNTMAVFNGAANVAAKSGFDNHVFSQPSIHRLTYYSLRESTGLTAQLVVRAIGKAVECFKRDKTKCPVFKPRSAVVYDNRIMRFKGLTHASLASVDGRLKIPMIIAGYQKERLQAAIKTGQADLVYVSGTFYLLVSIEMEAAPSRQAEDVIGVDLGVANIAVGSGGNPNTAQVV